MPGSKLIFLGHVVGQGDVSPITAKIQAICDSPAATDKKGIMRFLGMAGFYRKFCRNFADVALPLTELLKKKAKFVWSPLCQRAFDKIKSILTNTPVLLAPDFGK